MPLIMTSSQLTHKHNLNIARIKYKEEQNSESDDARDGYMALWTNNDAIICSYNYHPFLVYFL